MRLAILYVLASAVYSLRLQKTLEVLYDTLSCSSLLIIANSWDLASLETINSLHHLLSSYPLFQSMYNMHKPSSARSKAMVEALGKFPEFHPSLLSFTLCAHNLYLVEHLRPHLAQYHPQKLDPLAFVSVLFTDEDLRAIFQNQGYRPELLHTMEIQRKFIELQPNLSFDLDDERWIRDLDADPREFGLGPNLALTGALYYWLCSETLDSKKFHILRDRCGLVSRDVAYENGIPSEYNARLQALRGETAEMSPARRALWHGKLLYNYILMAASESTTCREDMLRALEDFITEYDVAAQSPIVLQSIFQLLKKFYMLIRVDADARPKFSALVHAYNNLPLVVANLGDFVHRWRRFLRMNRIRSTVANALTSEVDSLQLLEWWGGYEDICSVTLQSLKISPPILFKDRSQPPDIIKHIDDMTTLLSIISDLLTSMPGLMIRTDDGLEFCPNDNVSVLLCKAIARTITVAMEREERLAFPFSRSTIADFYSPVNELSPIQACVATELQLVHLLSNIPLSSVIESPDMRLGV
ncbi:hypothetical protein PSACC_01520 [Paramicrosporidium saccamoebae]|uniref:Uncharacterized protein n=1 Tax=Paramicrosporidium saccamoebae TaxID=1246581 RepID=A0A2H9TLP8_9FUNG|nr:hypothetical protein PSACC_01520 [Paramicrosporidium saccamoebae]